MPLSITEMTKAKRQKHTDLPQVVLMRALAREREVQKSLDYLINTVGVSVSDIARGLEFSRYQVGAWRKGTNQPSRPMTAFLIVEWAAYYRELGQYQEALKQRSSRVQTNDIVK